MQKRINKLALLIILFIRTLHLQSMGERFFIELHLKAEGIRLHLLQTLLINETDPRLIQDKEIFLWFQRSLFGFGVFHNGP